MFADKQAQSFKMNVFYGRYDNAKKILEENASVALAKDSADGSTVLHACVNKYQPSAPGHEKLANVVGLLLKSGADPRVADISGRTPYGMADEQGKDVFTIAFGSVADQKDAFCAAITNNNPDRANKIINSCSEIVTYKGASDRTLLHDYVDQYSAEGDTPRNIMGAISLLVDAGADLYATDDAGRTPYSMAVNQEKGLLVRAFDASQRHEAAMPFCR